MFILQHTHPPCQYADRLYFPVIFGQISPFLGHKKPRRAGCSPGRDVIQLLCIHSKADSNIGLAVDGLCANAQRGKIGFLTS